VTLEHYRPFVGIPHVKPHGCWRIVARVLQEVHGVKLPDTWGIQLSNDDLAQRALVIQQHLRDHGRRVDDPQPGDVCVMYRLSYPVHVALYAGDGWLLQSTSDIGASHLVRAKDVPYGNLSYYRP